MGALGSVGGAVGGSVGEIGIGGSASASYSDHTINLSLSGDIAAGLGIDFSVNLHINVKPIEDLGKDIAKGAEDFGHAIASSPTAHAIEHAASSFGHAIAHIFHPAHHHHSHHHHHHH